MQKDILCGLLIYCMNQTIWDVCILYDETKLESKLKCHTNQKMYPLSSCKCVFKRECVTGLMYEQTE